MFELYANSCHLHERDDLEKTNNVILPHDILKELQINDYLFFRIINSELGIESFCSVHEFTAPDDTIIMPMWLMEYLGIQEMSVIKLEQIMHINKGKFIRLEPQEKQFFKIPDNDKHLEASLSKFSILHKDLVFRCDIDNIPMTFIVKDAESIDIDDENSNQIKIFEDVIVITNQDINLDIVNKFPPTPPPTPKKKIEIKPEDDEFKPFSGNGQKLGGDNTSFNREEWLKRFE